MVTNESNPLKETQTQKAVISPMKKTRGKVHEFNRVSWNYMKKHYGFKDENIIQSEYATCPAKVNGMAATLVCYFDDDKAKAKGITIKDFETLLKYPEYILYEGYYVWGKESEIILNKSQGAGTSLLVGKIKKGDITDVGVVNKRTGAQKWLHLFG